MRNDLERKGATLAAEISARCQWLGSQRVAQDFSLAAPPVEASTESAAYEFVSTMQSLEQGMHFLRLDEGIIRDVVAYRSQRTPA